MSSWILLAPQHPNDPTGGAETLLVAVMLTHAEIEFILRQHEELGRRHATDDRVLGVELACGSMHVLTQGLGTSATSCPRSESSWTSRIWW